MNRIWCSAGTGLLLAAMVLPAGCASTQIVDILEEPIRIAVVSNNYLDVALRYKGLCDAINRQFKKPVVPVAELSSRSIKVHLADNPRYYHLMHLDPVAYVLVSQQHTLFPLAVQVNDMGKTRRQGLIVVPSDSPIKQLGELAKKRFAFGPYGSAYMFYNALQTLQAGNIRAEDLTALSYGADSKAVADKLLLGWADAGVVTDLWWQTTQDRTLDGALLKDRLRIIARTEALPEMIWVATENLTEQQRLRVQLLLLDQLKGKKTILQPLRARRYVMPDKEDFHAVEKLIQQVGKLPPRPLLEL